MTIRIIEGDMLIELPRLAAVSIDSCVTDPPYNLASIVKRFGGDNAAPAKGNAAYVRASKGFMGKKWDSDVAFHPETWAEVYRVLKPGGYLLAFGGTRTYHRLVCAIEDAGFEIRDTIAWIYGCLDTATEAVTPDGVKPYHKISAGDPVLCYDPSNGGYSYQPVLEVVEYDYDDTAFRIIGDFGEQVVTRNHRCIVERGGVESFQFAEEASRQREARVPVLESLSELQGAIPGSYKGAGSAQQPNAVCDKRGSQGIRAWRGHRSVLVRIVPFHLTGKVWCLRVPTGAFVAVRGGVAFPTGNSGFPKSHDVSKAIDKAAGVERKVVGEVLRWGNNTRGRGGQYANGRAPPSDGIMRIDPVTDAARQWSGWGTALKPAIELVVCAQKKFTAVPCLADIAESTAILEALLWSIAPAKFVERCLPSSQQGLPEGQPGSARWLADALSSASSAELSDMMDMFNSREEAETFLSIAMLWCAFLDAICSQPSMFTTKMESSLTTGLTILNSWISAIIPENIIRVAICQNGLWRHAQPAERSSNETVENYSGIPLPSAAGRASPDTIRRILYSLADIVAASSPISPAIIESIVRRPVQTAQGISVEKNASPAPALSVALLLKLPCKTFLNIVAADVWPLPTSTVDMELVCVARKPLSERTVAANVLRHATGAINVNACRVPMQSEADREAARPRGRATGKPLSRLEGIKDARAPFAPSDNSAGRWPANAIHDGSEEVLAGFPDAPGQLAAVRPHSGGAKTDGIYGAFATNSDHVPRIETDKSAARFFYTAKADAADRVESRHPTVKPTDLMRWLVRLVTPPGGTVLDPFCGTGSTLVAADQQGFNAIGIEGEAEYVKDARKKFIETTGLFATNLESNVPRRRRRPISD